MQLLPRVLLITEMFINGLCWEERGYVPKSHVFRELKSPGNVCVLAAKGLMQLERCSGGGVPCTREMFSQTG